MNLFKNIMIYVVVIGITVIMTNVIDWKALREKSQIAMVHALDLNLNETIAYLKDLNGTFLNIENGLNFSSYYVSERFRQTLIDMVEAFAVFLYIDPKIAWERLYHFSISTKAEFGHFTLSNMTEISGTLMDYFTDDNQVIVFSSALIHLYIVWFKGISMGVGICYFFLTDQVTAQLISINIAFSLLMFIFRESFFQLIKRAIYTPIRFWEFNKLMDSVGNFGFISMILDGVNMMIIIRTVLVLLGLPFIFAFSTGVLMLIVFFVTLYVFISRMHRDLKYKVELKIDATITMKESKTEGKSQTLMDRFSTSVLTSFWQFIPWSVRRYRDSMEFRPYRNLIAPNLFIYWTTPLWTLLAVPVIGLVDVLYYGIGWIFIYFWVYPYINNKRIADDKWNKIVDAAGINCVYINGTQIMESDGYFFNLCRSVALWLGWTEPYAEIVYKRTEWAKFWDDWIGGYPDSQRMELSKAYGLPYRYLKGLNLPLNPSLKEVFDLYIAGLEKDGIEYGDKTEPAISGFAKKLVKMPQERELYRQQLVSYTRVTYGIVYNPVINLPAMMARLDIDRPYITGQMILIPAEHTPYDASILGNFEVYFRIDPEKATLMRGEVDIIFNYGVINPISEERPEDLLYKVLYIRLLARRTGYDIQSLPPVTMKLPFRTHKKIRTHLTDGELNTVLVTNSYLARDGASFFRELVESLRLRRVTDPDTFNRYSDPIQWQRAVYLLDAYQRIQLMEGEALDMSAESREGKDSEDSSSDHEKGDDDMLFGTKEAMPRYATKIPSSMIADDIPVKILKINPEVRILKRPEPSLIQDDPDYENLSDSEFGDVKMETLKKPEPVTKADTSVKKVTFGPPEVIRKLELNFRLEWRDPSMTKEKVEVTREYFDYRWYDHQDWADYVGNQLGLPKGLSFTTVSHYCNKYFKGGRTLYPEPMEKVDQLLSQVRYLPEKATVSYNSIVGGVRIPMTHINMVTDRLKRDSDTWRALQPLLNGQIKEVEEKFSYFFKINYLFLLRFLTQERLDQIVFEVGFNDAKSIPGSIGKPEPYKGLMMPPVQETLTKYVNSQTLKIEPANTVPEVGLKIVGKQKQYQTPLGYMYNNLEMRKLVLTKDPGAPVDIYEAVKPDRKLVLEAVKKYEERPIKMRLDERYEGVTFKDFLIKHLDYFFNTSDQTRVKVRSVSEFSEDDLTPQSKKAYPGFKTRAAGVEFKGLNLDVSKAMAEEYRREVLSDHDPEHIRSLIAVPKTSKVGQAEVRVVLAPEMYFYINQYLLFEEFKRIVVNSKVSNDFSIFSGNFHAECQKFRSDHIKQELDLKSMGGRIPYMMVDIFEAWYGRFIVGGSNKEMLRHVLDDIFKATFMLPSTVGGEIFVKSAGWGDGDFATGNFDTFAMMVFCIYNVWKNIIAQGISPMMVQFENDKVAISSHGDNWLHSFALEHSPIYSWKVQNLLDLGQEVKGEIKSSIQLEGLELMGFIISKRDGYYVGHRPYAKTVKSLTINRREPKTNQAQREYEAGIIHSLLLVDCWNEQSYNLLQWLFAQYNGVSPATNDIQVKDRIQLLSKVHFNPREAWKTSPYFIYEGDRDETAL